MFTTSSLALICLLKSHSFFRPTASDHSQSDHKTKSSFPWRYHCCRLHTMILPSGNCSNSSCSSRHRTRPSLTSSRTWRARGWSMLSGRPQRLSVYQQDIWTNNDLEGWHRRLNNVANAARRRFCVLQLDCSCTPSSNYQ